MSPLPGDDKSHIEERVQRTVGIAALRRLRKMVDAWDAEERFMGTMARRLALIVGALAVLVALLLLFAPETLRSAARALSAIEPHTAGSGPLVERVARAPMTTAEP
jgi:hypothetical protein